MKKLALALCFVLAASVAAAADFDLGDTCVATWDVSQKDKLTFVVGAAPADSRIESLFDLGDTLEKIPASNYGFGISLVNRETNYTATWDVYQKDKLTFAVGVASADSRIESLKEINKLIGTVSYDLVQASDMGVTMPVVDLLRLSPFIGIASSRIDTSNGANNEFDCIVGVYFVKATM